MDNVIQRLKREARLNPDNTEALWKYIAALERTITNGPKPEKVFVEPDHIKIQCLVCEKDVVTEFPEHGTVNEIATAPWDRAIECRSPGNYGSQIWDDSGYLYFVLCDGCTIRHSHKMLARNSYINPDAETPLINARSMFEDWFDSCDKRRVDAYERFTKTGESIYPYQREPRNPASDVSHQNIKSYFDGERRKK